MAVELQLKNVDELIARFRRLPRNVSNKHMRRALRQGAAIVRDHIKLTAPIRPQLPAYATRPPPGRLRRLVRVKARRGRSNLIKTVVYYPKQGGKNDPKNAYYWRFVEFGTKRLVPVPYISVAVDVNFRRIVNHVLGETDRGLKQELAGLKELA